MTPKRAAMAKRSDMTLEPLGPTMEQKEKAFLSKFPKVGGVFHSNLSRPQSSRILKFCSNLSLKFHPLLSLSSVSILSLLARQPLFSPSLVETRKPVRHHSRPPLSCSVTHTTITLRIHSQLNPQVERVHRHKEIYVKKEDGNTVAIVPSDPWVPDASSEEVGMDKSDSNPKRSSTRKRSSKSRKSKNSTYQIVDWSSKSSGDPTSSTFATSSTSATSLGRLLNLLFLILLIVSGAVRSIMIFNDMLHGQVDSVAGDSVNKLVNLAASDSMGNELPRYILVYEKFDTSVLTFETN